jgi:hypothetical protein
VTPRYTVGHRVYTEGETDDLGNPREGWADPVPLKVFAIAPTASLADAEPALPSRDAVITGLTLYVPRGAQLGPHDRFVIDGEEWEQEGDVGDYSRGPFTNAVGHVVVYLKRKEG